MEHIKDYIEKANSFGKYYEQNVYSHLKEITSEITKEFKEVFEQHARDAGLVISNSVYENIYLFEFTDRVKEPNSLVEKLKNKNMIFDLSNSFNIVDLEDEQKILLDNFFFKIDDIIGIKILTSLNKDCENVLELLKKEITNNPNGIELALDGEIPTTMSNGRKIFKLKGCYKSKYAFELQVKSKIDSTWGDLEHNLFYKDYDFNYVKNNNKEIMLGIGSLLEQTENLMLSIRQSKNEFNNEYNKYSFYQSVNEGFKDFVQLHYNSNYVLEKNMDRIYGMYEICFGAYSQNHIVKVEDIELPQPSLVASNLNENFNVLKTNNFDIALLEAIHFNWIRTKQMLNISEDQGRIDSLVKALLCHSLNEVAELLEITLLPERYIDTIMNIINNNQFEGFRENLLINTGKLAQFVMINNAIDEVGNSSEEEEFSDFEYLELEGFTEFVEELKFILFNQLFIKEVRLTGENDRDKRIFISKMMKVLNKIDSVEKNKLKIVKQAQGLLNTILGGSYE